MRHISQLRFHRSRLAMIATVIFVAVGCSSNSVPAPDLNNSFAELTNHIEQMSVTLETIPDRFELDTRKKVDAATQLLEDTAKRLSEQATAFHQAWETLRANRNMTGDFDTSHVESYGQAMARFETQWERITKHNQPASDRLRPVKQMVDDATAT